MHDDDHCFGGVLHVNCEMYMDNVIVHGKTPMGFIDRLRQIFTRGRTYNISLNPGKSLIGMNKVENFPVPKNIKKKVRAFIMVIISS